LERRTGIYYINTVTAIDAARVLSQQATGDGEGAYLLEQRGFSAGTHEENVLA
jgi:hypothetical protein